MPSARPQQRVAVSTPQAWRRRSLYLTTCAVALLAGSAAIAQQASCPGGSSSANQSCTIAAGTTTNGVHVDFTGAAGTDSANGGSGGTYTLTNNSTVVTAPGQNEGIFLRLKGGIGSPDLNKNGTRGGDGGVINLTNTGSVTFVNSNVPLNTTEGFDDGAQPGVWDDPGRGVAIYAASIGGAGGGIGDTGVGGGSGGNGGRAGNLSVTNSGALSITTVNLLNGGAGILGSVVTGQGGVQDNKTAGDQFGGAAGDGNALTIANFGNITINSGIAGHYVWGIGAENLGGAGGEDNGNGGTAGTTAITNSGNINVWVGAVNPDVAMDEGVRGIYASSVGGPGSYSEDGSDNGGKGEPGSAVTVTTSGDVTVDVQGLTQPTDAFRPLYINNSVNYDSPIEDPANIGKIEQSAAILAISKGGDGGKGPQTAVGGSSSKGGAGAVGGAVDVTVQSTSAVTSSGNYVAGVLGLSYGGLGGDGFNNSKGQYGGAGGAVTLDFDAGSSVTTNGLMAFGVVAISRGGDGGNYHPNSGVANFNPANAGIGGAGGTVILNFGDITADGEAGPSATTASGQATVWTRGDYATGVLAQSVGGTGGDTGESFDLFGQTGANTGNGGAAGLVSIVGGVNVRTEGEYARGIVGQSIGGNGGTGSDSSGLIVLGGTGGVGGAANMVNMQVAGSVTTEGTSAVGVLGQAIGGGGGAASGADGVVAIGGSGGTGGATGAVDINFVGGSISTGGDYAYGIEAQSIGGGGGDGGSAFDYAAVSSIPAVGIGGTGGVAGDGNTVIVSNFGATGLGIPMSITTAGANAHGVLAQSIGGGGGSGGDANGGGLTILSFQMAGGGEAGGDGNTAQLSFDGLTVNTGGTHAAGLIAQSVGGGGGTGGSAYAHNTAAGFTMAVGIGGEGGAGGDGGQANVTLSGSQIITGTSVGTNGQTNATVTDSFGIVAQAIGGGGGMGGSSTSRAIDAVVPVGDVTFGSEVSIAIGGTGGTGGNGGTVNLSMDASSVQTQGDGSIGIIAQSVGGGGGIGGSADAIGRILGQSIADDGGDGEAEAAAEGEGESTEFTANVNVGVGGSGNTAGYGQSVILSLTNGSFITTTGNNANGILAQSIGGGGGMGAVGSADSKGTQGENLSINLGVGGKGGAGGNAGTVQLTMADGTGVRTLGDGARGVVLQSIGGGGGTSQSVSIDAGIGGQPVNASVTVGRSGANGGGSGSINAILDGDITTYGADADAILIQTIGGGGGLGGSSGGESGSDDSSAAVLAEEEEDDDSGTSVNVTVAVGGSGGAAGWGGDIGASSVNPNGNLVLGGTVLTYGDYADGAVLQSIGGGGGAGGNAASQDSQSRVRTYVGVGGSGGGGGNGGSITFDFIDYVAHTEGASAIGALIQTIGGGGGQGASGSQSSCGLISLGSGIETPDFLEDAASSAGMTNEQRCDSVPKLAQIASNGGTSGSGGTIATTANASATVTTLGDDAHGIVLQSIGAGGGAVGAGSSNTEDGDQGFSLTLGGNTGPSGSGGSGATGNGGTVTLGGDLVIGTAGDRAIGLVAQSIGGGGGISTIDGDGLTEFALGGSSSSGNGAAVTLTLGADSIIQTSGAAAHGIVAQSIGGGGGIAGDSSSAPLTFNNFNRNNEEFGYTFSHGSSATVTLSFAGSLSTTGTGAIGIVAQSIAGGGGIGGGNGFSMAGSTGSSNSQANDIAGDVNVTVSGNVAAAGENGIGVFAQSEGAFQNGVVDVTVSGSVAGGTGDQGTGVMIVGGSIETGFPSNTLTVAQGGTISSHSGTAVVYQGTEGFASNGLNIVNDGKIQGNIIGYNGNGSIISGFGTTALAAAATGDSHLTVTNSAGGLLIGASSYTADVINAGTLVIGEDHKTDALNIAGAFTQADGGITRAAIDFVRGTGDQLTVQGDVSLDGSLQIVPLSVIRGGRHQILFAEGGIAGAFEGIKSELISYELTQDGANGLWVEITGAEFNLGAQLTDDQANVANYLGRVFDSTDPTFADLIGTAEQIAQSGITNYADLLTDLSPGASAAGAALNFSLAQGRFEPLMGCDDALVTGPQGCVTLIAKGQDLSFDSSDSALGYDATVSGLTIAGQHPVEDWTFGGSFGLENSTADAPDGQSGVNGQAYVLGLSASRDFGGLTFTAALIGSTGDYDTNRDVPTSDGTAKAKGSYDAQSTALRLRLEQTVNYGSGYLQPMIDVDAVYTSAGGYTETGAGNQNLVVKASNANAVMVTPAVEAGRDFALQNGGALRAYGRLGWTLSSADNYTTQSRFQGASPAAGGFETALAVPDSTGSLSAGVQIMGGENTRFDLRYDGTIGPDSTGNALSLWFEHRF